jgi:hypothetical protein
MSVMRRACVATIAYLSKWDGHLLIRLGDGVGVNFFGQRLVEQSVKG